MYENAAQIFSIQPDGQGDKQLTSEEDRVYKCRPSWSLDHKQIAYFHYSTDRPAEGKAGVAIMNADGSNHRVLLMDKKIDTTKTRISWKPDGTVIYIQEKDFPSVLFGYGTTTAAQVDTIRIPKGSFIKEIQTLSPDARIIAGTGPVKGSEIMHMGAVKRSGGADLDFMKFFQQAPYHLGTVAWSYDSMYVAYELDVTIIIMNSTYAPGFKFYPISPMEAEAQFTGAAFSPSGQFIACSREKAKEGNVGSGDKEVRSDIWIMQINGAKPRQLTDSGGCFDPHW
jgi:Tol biopolymer transport system component